MSVNDIICYYSTVSAADAMLQGKKRTFCVHNFKKAFLYTENSGCLLNFKQFVSKFHVYQDCTKAYSTETDTCSSNNLNLVKREAVQTIHL